jgi:hypothetical protein
MLIIQNLPNFMPLRLIVQAMFMQQLRRWTYQVDGQVWAEKILSIQSQKYMWQLNRISKVANNTFCTLSK